MGRTHRLHHQPMQSQTERHGRDSCIDLGNVQNHPAYRLQCTHQVRHRLRKHGLRQSDSEDEGEAGSASRTGSKDLLWIVTWNSQSVAANGIRSTSAQPSTSTSADYAVKFQSDRDHPTANIMKNCWQDTYARTSRAGNRSARKSKRSSTSSALPTYFEDHSKQHR